MLALGGASYYYGVRQNNVSLSPASLQAEWSDVMETSEGDKWMFGGGVVMLLGSALAFGIIKFWLQERRKGDPAVSVIA